MLVQIKGSNKTNRKQSICFTAECCLALYQENRNQENDD